jgi:hypothetical protein
MNLSSHQPSFIEMNNLPSKRWKIILGISIIIAIINLLSLPTLYENISGDSVPNRPQREPPIEYQWDTAITRLIIALVSILISAHSYNQIRSI